MNFATFVIYTHLTLEQLLCTMRQFFVMLLKPFKQQCHTVIAVKFSQITTSDHLRTVSALIGTALIQFLFIFFFLGLSFI